MLKHEYADGSLIHECKAISSSKCKAVNHQEYNQSSTLF
jgi:hypothetical protein